MNVYDVLIAWGRGKSVRKAPNGFPHISPGMSGAVTPERSMWQRLDDDQHAMVDRAISELKTTKPLHHSILVWAYVYKLKDREIGQAERMSRSAARDVRKQAENWIEGRLAHLDGGPEMTLRGNDDGTTEQNARGDGR